MGNIHQKEKIIYFLKEKGALTQSELAYLIYGDNNHFHNVHSVLIDLVRKGVVIRAGNTPCYYSLYVKNDLFDMPLNDELDKGQVSAEHLAIESISKKIRRFYTSIKNYDEDKANTNLKTWDWCHKEFLKYKDLYKDKNTLVSTKNEIVENLSLHLANYLFSIGLYKDIPILASKDFKIHHKAVELILGFETEVLWDFKPDKYNLELADAQLFLNNEGIYFKLKEIYSYVETKYLLEALVTSILSVTFACIPGFTDNVRRGIKKYLENNSENKGYIEYFKLSDKIEKNNGKVTNTFKAMCEFAISNKKECSIKDKDAEVYYSPLRCIEIYFYEIGYELALADILNPLDKHGKERPVKINELMNKAFLEALRMKMCAQNDDFKDAARKIRQMN